MTDTREQRDTAYAKSKLVQFPRKKKGTYERTAARSVDRNKYRKDFSKVKK